jgi:hypothetical protein
MHERWRLEGKEKKDGERINMQGRYIPKVLSTSHLSSGRESVNTPTPHSSIPYNICLWLRLAFYINAHQRHPRASETPLCSVIGGSSGVSPVWSSLITATSNQRKQVYLHSSSSARACPSSCPSPSSPCAPQTESRASSSPPRRSCPIHTQEPGARASQAR